MIQTLARSSAVAKTNAELLGLHQRFTRSAASLRLVTNVWTTVDLRRAEQETRDIRQRFVDFRQAHDAWHQQWFPDERAALIDSLASLAAIRDKFAQIRNDFYKLPDGRFVDVDADQAHRDEIAAVIEAQLG